jgi:putative ABC transport system permease protein
LSTPSSILVARAAAGSALTGLFLALGADQPAVVPPLAVLAGLGIALGVGGLAGVYPAVKAARLAPAEALRVT